MRNGATLDVESMTVSRVPTSRPGTTLYSQPTIRLAEFDRPRESLDNTQRSTLHALNIMNTAMNLTAIPAAAHY